MIHSFWGLACAGWALTRAHATVSTPRWQTNPFALGVASGQPRQDSVVLWTRLVEPALQMLPANSVLEVSHEVFADEAMTRPVTRGTTPTTADRAWSVHVGLRGLEPARVYYYRFRIGDAISRTGRTRTAPPDEALPLRMRLALASCQHYEQGSFTVHREIAREDLDLVLFVGDYIYESGGSRGAVRRHGAPPPQTLDEYRARHALYKSDPDLQASHAAHPWITTWDDHEVVNDYADDQDQAYTPPAVFLRRRAAAYRAYFEHMPLLVPPDGPSMRIHDTWRWGRLADLWTLDCRQYRSHQACPDPLRGGGRPIVGCDELSDPARTMLGAQQEAWLAAGLRASRARWRVIAQASQVSPSGVQTPAGRVVYSDGWEGYPQARRRLLSGIAQAGLDNVLVLGGDVHRHVAAHLREAPNDPASPVVASEIVCSSVTSRGTREAVMAAVRLANPDIVHANGEERGYAWIEISPTETVTHFRATMHPVTDASQLRTQATVVIESGRAGPSLARPADLPERT